MIPTIKEVGDYAQTLGYDAATVHDWFTRKSKEGWLVDGETVRNWRAVLDGKMRHEATIKPAAVQSASLNLSYSLGLMKLSKADREVKLNHWRNACKNAKLRLEKAVVNKDNYLIEVFSQDLEAYLAGSMDGAKDYNIDCSKYTFSKELNRFV